LRSLEQAAAWIEEVGVALLFPNGDYVLPSLWEAVAGSPEVDWSIRDDEGRYVAFTPSMRKVWSWKDELPAQRLACVGLHVARTSALVAPRLVAAIYAATAESREAIDGLEREIAEAAESLGRGAGRRELRMLVGAEKRHADRAINALQRKLVLTNAGLTDEGSGWAATLHDLFTRRWKTRLRRLPNREDALDALAAAVVQGGGEVSAADLGAALKLRKRETMETLERLEEKRLAAPFRRDDLQLWSVPAPESTARSRAAGSRSSPRRSR
jgi:hypothetical protein